MINVVIAVSTIIILIVTAAAYQKTFLCLVGAWLLFGAFCMWEERKRLKSIKNASKIRADEQYFEIF